MATTEAAHSAVNGTYHPNPYAAEHYNPAHHAANYNAQPSNPPLVQANEPKNDVTKDEVGWFFVEQYYTTLSRSPDKLHLFYSRRSQFVFGVEAEKVPVAVGQKAIHERLKGLDFHDCKVRVLNVDSQASFDNIVVCVVGEMSNKSEPPRKFIQTFILAEQPNGYYVLNDIFRYLADDEEELVAEEAPVEEAPAVEKSATPVVPDEKVEEAVPEPEVERQADNEAAVQQLDETLEEVATTNGEAEPTVEEQPQAKEEVEAPAPAAEAAAAPAAPVEAIQPEKPKEPESTPAAASPAKVATPAPEKENAAPPKPAVPMSWASIASRNAAAAAAAAATAPTTASPAPAVAAPVAQPKAVPAPQQPAAPAAAPANVDKIPSQTSSSNGEWQTADHGKRQSRPQAAPTQDNTMAYVKGVNDKVDASLLKGILAGYGELKYFNVNRGQGCAFVEFADSVGFKAAVAANPVSVGAERVTVEERRQRYPPGFSRGGARGRGDRAGSQGRGGFPKEAGRYPSRGGRGGNVTPRGGRSQPQAS